MISLYVHPTCTSCRKAVALLADLGSEVERRNYFRDRFTVEELRAVLVRAGRSPSDMLSTRSRAYRDLSLADRQPTDDELLDLMVREPTLLRRPLAIGAGGSVVGFNAIELTDLAATERPG